MISLTHLLDRLTQRELEFCSCLKACWLSKSYVCVRACIVCVCVCVLCSHSPCTLCVHVYECARMAMAMLRHLIESDFASILPALCAQLGSHSAALVCLLTRRAVECHQQGCLVCKEQEKDADPGSWSPNPACDVASGCYGDDYAIWGLSLPMKNGCLD